MQDYILNWSTSTKQTITLTPKVALDPGTTSGTSQCSVVLFGRGAPRYGEGQQENFIRMLENFSSPIAPIAPTSGQLWFDSGVNLLKVYDVDSSWKPVNNIYVDSSAPPIGRTFEGMLWYNTVSSAMTIYQGGSWKSFGTPIPVAGVEEYNTMVASYNLIAGTPTDVSDRAASFNGRTSLITVTPSSANDFNLADYTSGTIELWVLPKSLARMTLIKQTFPSGSGDDTAWRLNINERGTITFEVTTVQTLPETSELDTVKLDEWNHIAVTFGSGRVAIFLNGKLVVDKSGFSTVSSTAGLYIGRNMTPINQAPDIWSFYGLMDCVRITRNVVRYTVDFDPNTLTDDSYLLANDPQAANVKFLMRMNTLAEDTGKTITATDVMITPQAFGYGQTELPTLSSVNNSSWINLLDKFRNIALHQGNNEALDNLSSRGFIIEPNAVQPINCGLMTLMREYDKTEYAINSLMKNSSSMAVTASALEQKASFSSAISWNALAPGQTVRYLDVLLTFANAQATRAFFNAGGKIKITKSFSPSTMTGGNLALNNALTLAGDTYIGGLINIDTIYERGSFAVLYQTDDNTWYQLFRRYDLLDYGGEISRNTIQEQLRVPGFSTIELAKTRTMPRRDGYYGLSTVFANVLETAAYINDDFAQPQVKYYISARTENSERDVRIRIQYSLDQGATVSGSLAATVSTVKPNSAYLNSPVISHPTASSTNTLI